MAVPTQSIGLGSTVVSISTSTHGESSRQGCWLSSIDRSSSRSNMYACVFIVASTSWLWCSAMTNPLTQVPAGLNLVGFPPIPLAHLLSLNTLPSNSTAVVEGSYPIPGCTTSMLTTVPPETFALSFAPVPSPLTKRDGSQYPLPPETTDTDVIDPYESTLT